MGATYWTARPVCAPHPCTTQFSAAELIAALFDGLHWQAKSVSEHPTPDAADAIQET